MFNFNISTPNLVFEYELQDAWNRKIHNIQVFDDGANSVYFTRYSEPHIFSNDNPSKAVISNQAMNGLKTILSDDRIYKNDSVFLPSPPNIFDGYIQLFFFSDGNRAVEYAGDNLSYCSLAPAEYPFTIIIIETLKKIGEVLIPEGVVSNYFRLEP